MSKPTGSGNARPRYITPEGERALRDELQYLWKVKRPEVTQAVREAAAQGDRSENAEYIYGKKQLREIDRRVRFLSKRLDELTVVDACRMTRAGSTSGPGSPLNMKTATNRASGSSVPTSSTWTGAT